MAPTCPTARGACPALFAHLFGHSRLCGRLYTCNLGELIPPVDAEFLAVLLG